MSHPTIREMLLVGMGFTMAAMLVGSLLFAGGMDYADAVSERNAYCDMVESGAWPDYRGIYKEECQ